VPASNEQDRVLQLLLLRPHQSETEEQRKLESFLDRLLMRLYSSTSLIVYLFDAKVVGDTIELAFNELPPEVVPKIVSIIGLPDVEPFSFRDENNHHLFTGFKFTPEEKYLEVL
jgi:hypothetical protein